MVCLPLQTFLIWNGFGNNIDNVDIGQGRGKNKCNTMKEPPICLSAF